MSVNTAEGKSEGFDRREKGFNMLRFVLGRSGAGKTEYLRNLFCTLAKEGNEKLLFIVPDQISFETETAFLRLLGPRVSQNITVLGFSRLCDRVFEMTGHRSLSFADEGVRHVVMSIALEQVKDELDLFSLKARDFDLCDLMLQTVKEYKKCAVSSEMLFDAAARCADETLSKKLRETALVYDAYNAVMEKSYFDPLDSLTRVARLLEKERLFEGYTVAVDAFYGFTAQEYDLLEQILKMCGGMFIALCDDFSNGNDTDIFIPAKRTKNRLLRIAAANGVEVGAPVKFTEQKRFLTEEMRRLEENVFRYDKRAFDEDAPNATYYRALNIYDECDFAARTVKKLLEGGYRCREIAVVARNTDRYAGILDAAFERYDIPYFMDRPFSIDAQPLIRFVNTAFDVINRGYDRDDVLTLLKTGLTSYSALDIADFENYLFTWDISGRGFFSPFSANPSGFSDTFSDDERALLEKVEGVRADIIRKLRNFEKNTKDADGTAVAKALMKLLYACECDKNISRLCDAYDSEGRSDLSDELIRMWGVLAQTLDKMVYVVGSYRIGAKRFSELLISHFSNTEISNIPRGMDEVDVAAADRALLSEKRAVFLIGAIDGEFPRTPVEAGVFTDNERLALRKINLSLSDSIEELAAVEKYYAYCALSGASEKIFLSSYAVSLTGEPMTPSALEAEMFSVLKKAAYEEYDVLGVGEHLLSKRAAFDYLVSRYRRESPQIKALKDYFSHDPDYAPVVASIDAAIRKNEKKISDKELAKGLFGETMMLSASQIETYHRCAFQYFCQYGLRIRERKRAAIDALEYGTMMHYVLEEFFRAHRGDDFQRLDREAAAREVSDIVDGYAEKHLGGFEDKSERFLFLFNRIRAAASALASHIAEELAQSEFRPADFELNIGADIPAYRLALENGTQVTVTGSVDRVDVMEKDGVEYIRVIDYKTGTKEFKLSDILWGINLQMFIYLSAIEKGGQKKYGAALTPAGVLYMPAVSPVVNASYGDSDEKINAEKEKQYTMKGVLLDDDNIIGAMEKEKKGVYIPVSLKKDDTLKTSKDGALASLEEFGAIFRKLDGLIARMAESLHDGEVDDVPVTGRYDACRYCKYKAVCRHEDGEKSVEVTAVPTEDVYREILSKDGDDDGAEMD